MSTSSTFGIMDIIILLGGLFMLYSYYLLMAKNEIKAGVLISQNSANKKCKDLEGFKREIGPKLLIFSVAAVIDGIVGLLGDYVMTVPSVLYWTCYILFFVVLIWYVIASRKIERKYF